MFDRVDANDAPPLTQACLVSNLHEACLAEKGFLVCSLLGGIVMCRVDVVCPPSHIFRNACLSKSPFMRFISFAAMTFCSCHVFLFSTDTKDWNTASCSYLDSTVGLVPGPVAPGATCKRAQRRFTCAEGVGSPSCFSHH